MVSISSYLADPVLTLLKEVAASLAFMAAAVSNVQPTITNRVIILQHCLGLCKLKTVLCSSSLSGTISVDGFCRCNGRSQRWSRFREAYLFSGHPGTTCWTLLLALISFNELRQPCFLTVMEELNQTGKGSLRRPCRPKFWSHTEDLLSLVAQVEFFLSQVENRPLGWQPTARALNQLLDDDNSKHSVF